MSNAGVAGVAGVPVGDPLLSATGLVVHRGAREIVRGVDLALHAGEVVALLGPNGAGKSTLLDALAGALTPTAGTVVRRGRVAVALQSGDLARRTVLANLTSALAWWGVPRSERPERALQALRVLGAEHLARRPADALSGGERRRVHLARVIAARPDVLMLDEPFAGLDGAARDELLADAAGVLGAPDRTALVVLHDRSEAWALADRLLVLVDGRILADGAPARLLDAPPSPTVARFLGYDGELSGEGGDGGELILTRAPHVALDPDGPLTATVTRVTPNEDGARVELTLADGRLITVVHGVPPRVGERLRVALRGGVRFPRETGGQANP